MIIVLSILGLVAVAICLTNLGLWKSNTKEAIELYDDMRGLGYSHKEAFGVLEDIMREHPRGSGSIRDACIEILKRKEEEVRQEIKRRQ